MAIQFQRLATPGEGVSTLLDFAPLAASIRSYQDNEKAALIGNAARTGGNTAAAAEAMKQGQLDTGAQHQRLANQDSDRAQANKDRQIKMLGGVAQAAKYEKDPARRALIWQTGLKRAGVNPQDLDPDELDPMTGPDVFLAASGMAQDPRESQLMDLKLASENADIAYKNAGTSKLRAEAQGSDGLPIDKRANVEEGLRKEVASTNKDYAIIRDASSKIEAFASNPSAASDVALIYSFMKVLDPTSVVRETEYATAQNAAGVPDQVRNVFNRILSGERLSPEQRKDFTSQAMTAARSQRQQYERSLKQYEGVAERLGVDKRNVILDYGHDQARSEALDAIRRGAPRDKVLERLRQNNVDTTGL
ncbi:MAG: hypothetical protein BVN33_14665 [Proteobacteria bacterium ST_bin13]|nr:MAG: hypothetical protein BVN33_14665 [Proteobacteria bacterium ST_bin13]